MKRWSFHSKCPAWNLQFQNTCTYINPECTFLVAEPELPAALRWWCNSSGHLSGNMHWSDNDSWSWMFAVAVMNPDCMIVPKTLDKDFHMESENTKVFTESTHSWRVYDFTSYIHLKLYKGFCFKSRSRVHCLNPMIRRYKRWIKLKYSK